MKTATQYLLRDLKRLINDGRIDLHTVNESYTDKITFNADFCGQHIGAFELAKNYSNIVTTAIAINEAHPTRSQSPVLAKLRVVRHGDKKRVLMACTDTSNLEFHRAPLHRCSDALAGAVLDAIHNDKVKLINHTSDAEVSFNRYSREYIIKIQRLD